MMAVWTTASIFLSVIAKYLAIFAAFTGSLASLFFGMTVGPLVPNAPAGKGSRADQYCRKNSVAALWHDRICSKTASGNGAGVSFVHDIREWGEVSRLGCLTILSVLSVRRKMHFLDDVSRRFRSSLLGLVPMKSLSLLSRPSRFYPILLPTSGRSG